MHACALIDVKENRKELGIRRIGKSQCSLTVRVEASEGMSIITKQNLKHKKRK